MLRGAEKFTYTDESLRTFRSRNGADGGAVKGKQLNDIRFKTIESYTEHINYHLMPPK